MRGMGQIAELCEIAEPDVAAITNVGPVHLELLGTLEAIAEAKAEILAGLDDDGRAVVPADAEALEPHLARRASRRSPSARAATSSSASASAPATGCAREIGTPAGEATLRAPVHRGPQPRQRRLRGRDRRRARRRLEAMARRAPRHILLAAARRADRLPAGAVLVNDCYNANPISMRAALDHLAVARADRPRGSRCSAGWPSSARTAPATTARSAPTRASSGSRPLVGVGELARDYAPDEWVAGRRGGGRGRRRAARRG